MEWLTPYLPDVWIFIIAFFLLYYAVTDGCDLGVGILSMLTRDETERGLMMATLESTWHTNHTWLIILGGMLFGAFPLFYGLVLSALYAPILLMLLGFAFRGIALDFRAHSEHKTLWSTTFGVFSAITAVAQGFALGGLIGGLEIHKGQIADIWGWATPFTALVTAGLLFGYTMLGANYLIMKTVGELQRRSYRYSLIASFFTLAISVATYIWTVYRYPFVMNKWTALPDNPAILVLPALAVLSFAMYYASVWRRRELAPLLWNAAVVLFSFAGLSVSMYPHMIPSVMVRPVTIHEAAASTGTLVFMLVVSAIVIPIILIYTTYEFWVFRGKVTRDYGEDLE